ncbi:xaa-Arg dipeptidase-like [Dermacentor andersoni]|uniref:xaa-Arg dipeptidase-like n=1 Tax=Dermacentor andersoni TaxID=34620 RepID=UPI002417980E|nr:xaa-Arg dipeptidase-like [Dermacentor andersoni]
MDPVARCVVEMVDVNAKLLNDVQASIWRMPEVRFEEKKAHDLLTGELYKAGFRVTPSYVLPTGFRAEYSQPDISGPCICFVAEYDAVSEVGHACGHNLIAEAALGASLALKKALETTPDLPGRVVCLGTPAEEGGSGKLLMAKGGALADVDAVIMAHPSSVNDVAPPYLASGKVHVRYTGKALYVVSAPPHPVNALDAAVTAYTAVTAMRQHMRPTWKVHGVITRAGLVANVIPDETELLYYYRAPNALELEQLRRLLENCFQGAAVSTGCTLDLDWQAGYEALLTNWPLAEAFRKSAASLGLQLESKSLSKVFFIASSDMGHMSQRVPTIQPTFAVCSAPNHSRDFAAAVCHKEAQGPTLLMAKAMALTGLQLFRDPELLKKVRKSFSEGLAFYSPLP